MSQLKITNAGLTYKDLVFAGAETQNITHFIFANIAGLNEGDVIDPNMAIPTNDIVHTQPIDRVSALDGNAVVMSAVLGYDVGNFEFNWFGAVATKADNSQVLIAVVQTALQTKTKTVGPSVGNYSVKSIVWRSQNIADNLNVTLSALPWQLNESAFVSKTDFEAHNHDAEYLAITAQAQSAKTADKLGELLPSDFAQTDHNHGNIRVIDRSYSVSNTVIENLKNIDGNFFGGTALRVRGITTGTGTFNTDSEAIFWHDGVTWKVNQVSGIQSSNCVEFVIFNGKPSVKTAHPNKYLVRVHHEEYIHSQKASGAYFGLGQQLSVVNGHFKHNGYRVFTEDYLPTASELGITPETIGAISVSSGGNIAIETTTYGL
ncbi:hypothetical protein CJF42_22195, partial [Pseudoalteromonas sp. NBT06-2]|uniref:phage tail-collar fiber domain-containing protein n=1 Tax=Pseudoalteromonas sp. NBT06-2 TaxID=2025950 RepID=UPI000BC65447